MGGNLSVAEFEERCFRFSVRCDRDMNRRLEKAAKKAGLSVTSFVQRHFETILDAPSGEASGEPGFSAIAFAGQHDISPTTARLWNALNRAADDEGFATGSVADFAALAGIEGNASYHFAQLRERGLVKIVTASRGGRKGIYRIFEPAQSSPATNP